MTRKDRPALAIALGIALGAALCFVGGSGVFDLTVNRGERIGLLGADFLFGPAVAVSGVLVLWSTWLWASRATPVQLRTYGIGTGLLGLALLVLPLLFDFASGARLHTEQGMIFLIHAIFLGEPGACLLLFSLILIALGRATP